MQITFQPEKQLAYKLLRQSNYRYPNGRKCKQISKPHIKRFFHFKLKKAVLHFTIFLCDFILKKLAYCDLRSKKAKLDFHLASSPFIHLSRWDYTITWLKQS